MPSSAPAKVEMSLAENPPTPAGRASETVPISALNHYLYCPRRAYLIHAEGLFVANEHTLLGDLAHEHVDFPGYEQRAGWTLLRALPLFSDKLGLSGKADLVEVQREDSPAAAGSNLPSGMRGPRIAAARPVEYKKGPKRRWANDEVQLCAQALCLEEMFGLTVPAGAVFHAQSQQRHEVLFDPALRALTLTTLRELRDTLAQCAAPAAVLTPRCEGCSLHGQCLPEAGATPDRQTRLFEPRNY